jgi:hypothetical protein
LPSVMNCDMELCHQHTSAGCYTKLPAI